MTRRDLAFWIMLFSLLGSFYIADTFSMKWLPFAVAIPIVIFGSIAITVDSFAAWLNKKVGS